MTSRSRSFFILLLAIVGCSDGPTDPSGEIGLQIIAGGGARDTVGTQIAAPVVAQYRDSTGELRAGVQVRIEGVGATGVPLYVGLGANSSPLQTVLVTTTDAAGRVTASVRMGNVAGTGWVRVRAPQLGLADSVSFEVLPGALTQFELGPIDTALYVGATVQLRARMFDRWHNERTGDVVAWSSAAGVIETSATGQERGWNRCAESRRVTVAIRRRTQLVA